MECEEQLQKIKEHLQEVILREYKNQGRAQVTRTTTSIEENQNIPNMS